jgi:hypothetical protein
VAPGMADAEPTQTANEILGVRTKEANDPFEGGERPNAIDENMQHQPGPDRDCTDRPVADENSYDTKA